MSSKHFFIRWFLPCYMAPILGAFGADVDGRGPATTNTDLTALNLEDLMHVKVTSVSKRPESLVGAAAAVYVVSSDDIQRQGFTTIADSLRTVPGMDVAQINSHTWGVSSRGFNGEYATKLLVLNDGRSVYSPLDAGVFWDVQDMMLEDLDRIEVIRGPGATLWGANAVNGVVNIISKSASETQGLLATGGGGTQPLGFGAVRYGGKLGENTYYRVYGKYDDHDSLQFSNGDDANDAWWMGRGGMRIDWEPADNNLITLQGDAYDGRENWSYTLPIASAPFTQNVNEWERVSGDNVLGRWTRTFEDDSELKVLTYFDHTERQSNLPEEIRNTFDFEPQYSFVPLPRNAVVCGLGYNVSADAIQDNYANTFNRSRRTLQLFSAFVQDEITLVENRLRLTLGSKFEHNDFTGFEIQPSGRLAWTPSDRQTIWLAVSRAVRTPSRAESDVTINRPSPFGPAANSVITILGNPNSDSEELMAYELGYRILPVPTLSFDLSTYFNRYEDLRSLEPVLAVPTPPTVGTLQVGNGIAGDTYGVELASEWMVTPSWRLRGEYTYFHIQLDTDGGNDAAGTVSYLNGNTPSQQFSVNSYWDLPHDLEFDTGVRYVGSLSNPHVSDYATMDARLAWRPTRNLEFSLVGQNLIQERHVEFVPTVVNTPQREVERSVYGKMTWQF